MAKISKVDPDTGYTPEESKASWAKEWPTWEQICKQREKEASKKSRKLARNPEPVEKPQTKSVDLKTQAVNLYGQGLGPNEVAKLLSITYANAYYYKRFVKNEKAAARLKESLKRV